MNEGWVTSMRHPATASAMFILFVVLLAVAVATAGCGDTRAAGKRVIVLGFDGMDYSLTQRFMSEGRLPNLERLAELGGFTPLRTSIPPQSPVAWSEFLTGLDAGGHGIYDFIHRDPETMVPYLSTARTEDPSRIIRLGGWQLPLKAGKVVLLRHGTPFWEVLEQAGVPTTIVRMPANFPPSGSASRELSGMGTPDIIGSPGTFAFFTTVPDRITREVTGGTVYPAEVVDNVFHGRLDGPANPFRADSQAVSTDFTVYLDPTRPVAKIVLGGQEFVLSEGEWSDWVAVEFELIPYLQDLRGICRFYLRQVRPQFELYVTPINIDPSDPALPISTPSDFAAELSQATGRFYTQGMPEDTNALTAGVFDEHDFLLQASMAAAENRRQYAYVLDSFEGGLLFHYFGNLDQVSHVMWRAIDPDHPAHDPVADVAYRKVIENLYVEVDEIVGETLQRMGENTTLIVMSDHGFAPWKRAFSLNSWLKENGYLTLIDPSRQGEMDYFGNVDWSRTQAYGLGFNGLYINLRGRDRFGIVPLQQRRLIIDEIARQLLRVVDPQTGNRAITKVYRRDEIYEDSGQLEIGPDLIVGYARGVRGSDDSTLGKVPRKVFSDNTGKWSGDHLMDHETVPGVLLTNRPLRRPAASLKELAAAVLAEFGIEDFPPRGEASASSGG